MNVAPNTHFCQLSNLASVFGSFDCTNVGILDFFFGEYAANQEYLLFEKNIPFESGEVHTKTETLKLTLLRFRLECESNLLRDYLKIFDKMMKKMMMKTMTQQFTLLLHKKDIFDSVSDPTKLRCDNDDDDASHQ